MANIKGRNISNSFFQSRHLMFVQKLAQNWRQTKNHLPEIRISG